PGSPSAARPSVAAGDYSRSRENGQSQRDWQAGGPRERYVPARRATPIMRMTCPGLPRAGCPRRATVSPSLPLALPASRWELAAEQIAVRIRWFGLVVGFLVVNLEDTGASHRAVLNAILALGAVYTLLDTYQSLRGRVFLRNSPLWIALL